MQPAGRAVSITVALAIAWTAPASAGEHLVSASEIAARLLAASAEQAGHRLTVERLLALHLPAAMDDVRVRAAVAALSDHEQRDLARRAGALRTDPVARGTTKTLIIIGAIVLVAVLLAAAIVESCKEQGAECLED